jgi:hypothetical protein
MIAIVILNIALAAIVLFVIVGGLGWSIGRERTAPSADRPARMRRARRAGVRRAALQR